MPTPTKGARLGSGPAHERLMLANLATSLFERGRVVTTAAKAKRLRPVAERLITFAKRGDVHARRQVLTVVRAKDVVHTLFTEIGPRYAERAGGYTRITKLGPRQGDGAPMAVLELVEARTVAQEAVGEAERARGTRFRRRSGAAARTETGAGTVTAEPAEPLAEPAGSVEAAGSAESAAEPAAAPAAPAAPAAEPTPEAVPTMGDTDESAAPAAAEQVAVPTEGGDTEVVTEAPDEPQDAGQAPPVQEQPSGGGSEPAS